MPTFSSGGVYSLSILHVEARGRAGSDEHDRFSPIRREAHRPWRAPVRGRSWRPLVQGAAAPGGGPRSKRWWRAPDDEGGHGQRVALGRGYALG